MRLKIEGSKGSFLEGKRPKINRVRIARFLALHGKLFVREKTGDEELMGYDARAGLEFC